VTEPRLPDRDTSQVDALVADRYLDALLAAADRRADDAPTDPALDPDVREAARVLRAALVRVHPSFRFEERLAARLQALAATQAGRGELAAGGGTVVPFPGSPALDEELGAILRGDLDPSAANDALDADARQALDRRPLIVTGAITSAAISLAGVAWVAWRASRPAARRSAMGRAARTAHARRDAIAGIGELA
jgi:hypothetical protein